MSDIRARASRAIFQMAQQSDQRRTQLQGRQVEDMSKAIHGVTDYLSAHGKPIEAPLAPFGKAAWLGSKGKVHFFDTGTNPGADYQPLKPR